jgi:hypothetical protein
MSTLQHHLAVSEDIGVIWAVCRHVAFGAPAADPFPDNWTAG